DGGRAAAGGPAPRPAPGCRRWPSCRAHARAAPQPGRHPRVGTPCMPISLRNLLLLPSLALAALALVPAAGHANPRQFMSFEAPNELLDDGARDQTLDEIKQFGVTNLRQLVDWSSYAPRPNAKRKPNFNASDPN